MASHCCFWWRRTEFSRAQIISSPGQLISIQDMLGLLVRPDVGVIVIQGIGGSGKTWAAKAAFRAARISNLFEEYIWVSLSMNCSMRQCINKIAASLSSTKIDNSSVERTKSKIKEYLAGRKFLLVLDNAYFTEENILECLGVPRPQQQSLGSKIFVTTRSGRAERVMEPDVVITPQPLTYKESYDLLKEKIGKDISLAHDLISLCYGVPLVIILLAGVLRDAPNEEVNAHAVLGTKVSVFNKMHRMVKFGYHLLPSNAQRCLLYCLLFPEAQEIPVKVLIWHWIMDGLLPEGFGFDEANSMGKEILDVLVQHGMIYLEDDDHLRMHDVIRETVSGFGFDNGYKNTEQRHWHFDDRIVTLNHRARFNRVSSMYDEMECLHGSPRCFFLSSLLLRGYYLLKDISEDFFCYMGKLGMLDLSFTRIKVLPPSISCLTKLRMLLLTGCDHLEEIRHIGSLVQLEVLDASGCCSLNKIDSGSSELMEFLKILDLSATSITLLGSIPTSMELRHLNLQGCPFLDSELPYGVSNSGAVQNLQLGSIEDLEDWMDMLWLPCGLTFQLSQRFGMEVSLDTNTDSNAFVYASDACFLNCLKKDSPLWFNSFRKLEIVISPSMDDHTMNTDAQVTNTDFTFQNSRFGTMHFAHSIVPKRYLELNCTVGVPSDLEGILCHAEVISLKGLKMAADLNVRSMKAVRELWIENCEELESLLTPDEVQALSAVGSLQSLWISNIENLSSFG